MKSILNAKLYTKVRATKDIHHGETKIPKGAEGQIQYLSKSIEGITLSVRWYGDLYSYNLPIDKEESWELELVN